MPGQGLDHIHIEGEKLLVLDDVLGMAKAKEMAEAQKIKAFGLLAGLLSRPKAEDIELVYEEKRYDAFWHVHGSSRFEYKRKKTYKVPVENMVQDVEILSAVLKAQAKAFELEGVERCIEEYNEESTIDAQTDQPGDFMKYLKLPNRQITSTDEITSDGTPIVALETKPAFLVRKTVNALIKAIQADQILDEQIGIHEFALYFLPIYTFEFLWKPKDKRVAISFDGATGEIRPKANKITQKLRSSFTNAEIFEFSKEVANFVPGGSLAMLVGKKAYEMTKKP